MIETISDTIRELENNLQLQAIKARVHYNRHKGKSVSTDKPTFRGFELPAGRQRLPGLMKQLRERKRIEAEARNAKTPDSRRSRKRQRPKKNKTASPHN
jgi:hypothetical protein